MFLPARIDQVALIVEDLEVSMKQYSALMGIGPWNCYQYDSQIIPHISYRGNPSQAVWKIAMADVKGMNYELIQFITRGDNIYSEYVDDHGFGFHHLGVNVADTAEICRKAAELGIETIMEGKGFGIDGDGHFAYLDTKDILGVIIELREIPKHRRAPHWTFPQ